MSSEQLALSTAPLSLGPECWGDRVHRAYRNARNQYGRRRDPQTGEAKFSYRSVATKLRVAGIDASDQALMRLEELDELPKRMRQRQLAYFALIAYGYDPADFDLTERTVVLTAFDVKAVCEALAPG